MADYGGYTGKILRVNLSNEQITEESIEPYLPYLGGMGLGYRVMWNEVPAGTDPFEPENRVIVATGPLAGTGAPSSGRTNITSLLPSNPYRAVADSHMGGYFSTELKYAGWDAIIIQGRASRPVWLRIENDQVSIQDARRLWGKGTFDTIAMVTAMMGKTAQVAAIGPAGENQVNLSVIRTGSSHSAGGHGGIFGSKNLKAIGVLGDGAVHIKGERSEWLRADREMMQVIGANNQHVVPSTPQPWAEYHDPASRWTARDGLYWGAADPPVETENCEAGDVNRIGYRTQKGVKDHGPVAEEYTVKMGGCSACPIRCHSNLRVPQLEEYGYSANVSNTCMGYFSPGGVMVKGFFDTGVEREGPFIARTLGSQIADDLGLWFNYGQMGRDFAYAYDNGILQRVLPAAEYNEIPWDLLEAGDPRWMIDFFDRLAYKKGEISHFADGAYWIAERWNFGDDYWNSAKVKLWSPLGFPVHHSNESNGQVGALISCMFNRDAQSHTHQNFLFSGLPVSLTKEIAGELWGDPSAVDEPQNYTPMNRYKAVFAKWSIIRNVLHDSLSLCNWIWPMAASPLKERNYRGNTALESIFYSLATGIEKSEDELDLDAERVFTLHRALTVKQMGTTDMRNRHDGIVSWVFEKDPEKEPFTPGTIKLEREDMELAKTMLYEEMGWHSETGAPTRATLERLGMTDVADELASLNLLPT
jgi:aldehyde:ferredoxin oxidoreductase